MKLKKDLNNMVFKMDIDDTEVYLYTPLSSLTDKDIIKNSTVFDIITETLQNEDTKEELLKKISINLDGYIYSRLEVVYKDDIIVDKKFDTFKNLIDNLYLNTKVFKRGKELSILEFEKDMEEAYTNIIKFQILFFLLTSLLSSVKKVKTNEEVGTIADIPDLYLTSLTFGDAITYLKNTKMEN